MSKCFFVAGTDTGVGKTFVSEVLLRAAAQAGYTTLGLKPVAAGAERNAKGEWENEDARRLIEAANIKVHYATVNPFCFERPVSPHLAAAAEDTEIAVDDILLNLNAGLSLDADFTLIEGAGGWRVPLNDSETMADLAKRLGFPVLLVVGVRLGCLNHAQLTLEAMRADGVEVIGWVANEIDPDMSMLEDNIASLRHRLDVPLIARVPYSADALQHAFDQNVFSKKMFGFTK